MRILFNIIIFAVSINLSFAEVELETKKAQIEDAQKHQYMQTAAGAAVFATSGATSWNLRKRSQKIKKSHEKTEKIKLARATRGLSLTKVNAHQHHLKKLEKYGGGKPKKFYHIGHLFRLAKPVSNGVTTLSGLFTGRSLYMNADHSSDLSEVEAELNALKDIDCCTTKELEGAPSKELLDDLEVIAEPIYVDYNRRREELTREGY